MNGIGLAIYLYAGFLSFILGLLPLYVFIKYPKLERKNKELVYSYPDNLKNVIPKAMYDMLIVFAVIPAAFITFFCYLLGKIDIFAILIAIFCYLFLCYVLCFKRYIVEIYKNGFYFNQFYTWNAFDGYEKIGNKIKLIGKKWISPNVYLRDKDGKLEEILKKYFKY
ncbi:hypothetical protein [Methanotorris igneus]|uniref:DUF5673 domain-containing protein n=1 Tax=Methanotorris igneus (strain DSM 5666 / JCM 11834 / Kol 5) TaxID=880724 RepID=F6BDS7_METIK|nr:hypothetical protein [Methanotorris igneus]AEF96638.1 hypothetical protein Metig_1099 [Methanotorris igneus Kol 5]